MGKGKYWGKEKQKFKSSNKVINIVINTIHH